MKVIAFLTDYSVVDRIINHLKLTFVADKPPPTAYRLPGTLDGRRHWCRRRTCSPKSSALSRVTGNSFKARRSEAGMTSG